MYQPHRTNRKAIIHELQTQLRYASTAEERATIQARLNFWLNYNPHQ